MKLQKNRSLIKKLKKIRILVLDVDGVLTDGRVYWLKDQGWNRFFHIKDGYGIRLLKEAGIEVGVISGSDSADIRARVELLKIKYAYLGDLNKLDALHAIAKETGFAYDEMAYMGDDLFDLPVLERVGFSATVPNAIQLVKDKVDYVTETEGGWGAVREVADALLALKV